MWPISGTQVSVITVTPDLSQNQYPHLIPDNPTKRLADGLMELSRCTPSLVRMSQILPPRYVTEK